MIEAKGEHAAKAFLQSLESWSTATVTPVVRERNATSTRSVGQPALGQVDDR